MGRDLFWFLETKEDVIHSAIQNCKNIEFESKDEIDIGICGCHRCLMCWTWNSLEYTGIEVGHSYRNPIWRSKWNVQYFRMVSYDECELSRKLLKTDIEYAHKRMKDLGDPETDIDIEAKEETMKVLSFVTTYFDSPYFDVYVNDMI